MQPRRQRPRYIMKPTYKPLQLRCVWTQQHGFGGALLGDPGRLHKRNPARNLVGEAKFVRDGDHRHALLRRMGRAMVDLCCASFCQVPRRIVLDVDDTFDAVHGVQQLRLFNFHTDKYAYYFFQNCSQVARYCLTGLLP
jgi:hypothetical protein